MKAEFINPFIIATKNVLTTMARTHPNVGKPVVKQDDLTWGEVNGLIGMAGDEVTGNMVLSFDERSILAIVSAMLMEEFTTINADVIDAVGEITNMISGGAKKELSLQGFNFNMASPIMMLSAGLAPVF